MPRKQPEEKIYPGLQIGKLTVLNQAESSPRGSQLWLCKCQCGTELLLNEKTLKNHKVRTCGCESNPVNLIGQKFGTLTVIERAEYYHTGNPQWLCRCDCGTIKKVSVDYLRNPRITPNCGDRTKHNVQRKTIVREIIEKKIQIQPGMVFGKLTVFSEAEKSSRGTKRWLCKCDCGKEIVLNGASLTTGNIASCGCTADDSLIGQKFGKLTVIERDVYNAAGEMQWLCKCDCGNTRIARTDYLTKSKEPNCGCVHVSNSEDITGQKFGLLTAIRRVENSPDNKAQWLCQCDCGNTCIKQARRLKNATFPPNCGCLANQKRGETFKTHGMADTRPFRIWQGMRDRCTNPNNPNYKHYGGRGIAVCNRWLESFESFWEDMKDGYQEELTLDRINVDGNYEKNNCRWATQTEQSRNKRDNVHISTYLGTKLLVETAEITGVNASTIKSRIDAGLPDEFAIVPHLRGKGVRKAVNTIKQMYDDEAPAVWLGGELEEKVDEIMETAEVQADAIREWDFGPVEITIGKQEKKEEPQSTTVIKLEQKSDEIKVSWETKEE